MLQGEAAMASGAPVKELCEEATCPICLEYFKDLVIVDDCGHSFCKGCLTRYWGESADASCPLCSEAVQQLEEGERTEGGMRERHHESLKLLCKEEEALIGLLRERSRESWEHSDFPMDEASQEYKMTDNGNAGTGNGRKGRGVSWRHKETLDLLDIWGEQKIQDQLRSSHRNIDFFEYIAQEMAARGHRRTAVECRSKTKVMRLEYKRVIGHNSRPGSNKVTCPFYKQLHRILRGDASVKPKRVSRSLNFKRGPRQGAVADPPSSEEHLSHEDLPMINIGEYLKEESPDNTGDGMVSSNGAEEEMAETDGINIIQVDEEASNEGSGRDLDSQRPQVSPEAQDPPDNVDAAAVATNPKASLPPGTRLSMMRSKKKRDRAESMFQVFMQQAKDEYRMEQEEMGRDRGVLEKFLKVFEQEAADSREERRQCLEAMRTNCDILQGIVSSLNKLTDAIVIQQQTGAGNPSTTRHPLHSATHKENLPHNPVPVARNVLPQEALPSHPTSSTSTPPKNGPRRPTAVTHTPPRVMCNLG
ncbi:myb/SANT-like DNA-binding domain-containing protein 7 [Elgaria multicarinata webbii]|uniref:myb/SANT-like DNA-binding domain-containing protein 7 n=1 Tax=Elgaria multicarinata webbii TaxID=159646 RepID=UPI002FCD1229